MDSVTSQKAAADAAAYARTLAEARGRNTTLAAAAVEESRAFTDLEESAEETLYVDGTARLLSEEHFADLPHADELMRELERRVNVLRALRSALDERSVFVWIGGENPAPELRSVLTKENGLIDEYARLFKRDGVELRFSADVVDGIVKDAERLGTGVRGLRNVMENLAVAVSMSLGAERPEGTFDVGLSLLHSTRPAAR